MDHFTPFSKKEQIGLKNFQNSWKITNRSHFMPCSLQIYMCEKRFSCKAQ